MLVFGTDGNFVDKNTLSDAGFELDPERDFLLESGKEKYNFVGIVRNDNNDLLVVFPKHFKRSPDELKDIKELFALLVRYYYELGNFSTVISDNDIQSFPFNQFYNIYEYYSNYGLPRNHRRLTKESYSPKIDWKTTVRTSQKYLNDGKLTIWGIKYEHSNHEFNFLADCIIYVINYTLETFNIFMELETIDDEPRLNIEKSTYPFIIDRLNHMRNEVFKDLEIKLIENLIVFFEQLSYGYTSFIKTYSFFNIWEKMVSLYVSNNSTLLGLNGHSVYPILALERTCFNLKNFAPSALLNDSKANIVIDHYYLERNTKRAFVLDSKYKFSPNSIDYKQIFYWLFIRDYLDINSKNDYSICCALILPTEGGFEEKVHLNITLGKRLNNLEIKEIYLNMRNVISYFLK